MGHPPGAPYGPPPQAGYPPPAAPQTRRGVVIVSMLIVVLVLAVAAIGIALVVLVRGDDGPSTGPADLLQPLRFQQVAEVTPAPCAAGTISEVDGKNCYRLGTNTMTVNRVEEIRAVPPQTGAGWAIDIKLTPADASRFGWLSGQAAQRTPGTPGNQIAIVVGDRVLAAPAIAGGRAITGGALSITGSAGQFTQTYVNDMIRRMTGRKP